MSVSGGGVSSGAAARTCINTPDKRYNERGGYIIVHWVPWAFLGRILQLHK